MAVIDQVYAPDYVQHDLPTPVIGMEAFKQYVTAYLTAFPDLDFTIEDLIAEGDKVVWRFSSTGTQTGPFVGIPPTGKTGTVPGVVIFRLENSRIAEGWVNVDSLSLLQQLGVRPMSA